MYACVCTHHIHISTIRGDLVGPFFLTGAEITELEARTEELFHQGLETMKDGISVCYVNLGEGFLTLKNIGPLVF